LRKVIADFVKNAKKLLSQSSVIIDLYERGDFSFPDVYLNWLRESEKLLEENNKPEQSKVASIRSQVLAAKKGIFNQNIQIKNKSINNIVSTVSIFTFQNSQEILYNVLAKDVEKLKNAETIINQVMLVALQNNIIDKNSLLNTTQGNLFAIWNAFNSNAELKKGLNQVLLTISYVDAIIILDETISKLNSNNRKP
jgi:hypothetical protein